MANTHHYDIFINHINQFSDLPQKEVAGIKEIFFYKKIKKNQYLLEAGNKLSDIGYNINGLFRYFYIDYEGNDITKYFVSDNNFILSISSLIEQAPSLFYIQALTDSDVLLAPADRVFELIQRNAYWQKIYKYLLETTYILKEKREAEFLLYDATDRYLHFMQECPEIIKNAKQHYIASYLGIAPEHLSRIRAQLLNDKYLIQK
jgi:CRP-like cAMP-binding protein